MEGLRRLVPSCRQTGQSHIGMRAAVSQTVNKPLFDKLSQGFIARNTAACLDELHASVLCSLPNEGALSRYDTPLGPEPFVCSSKEYISPNLLTGLKDVVLLPG
jgi:hypothetical protein